MISFNIWLLACCVIIGFGQVLGGFTPIYIPKTVGGKYCDIPFVYRGTTYHDCIMDGSDKPWCSLEKVFTSGKSTWDYCVPRPKEFDGCLIGTPNVTMEEVEEILREHNLVRAKMPALKMRKMEWNSELAMKAQAAANRCTQTHVESVLCGNRYETGQNLYYNYYERDYPDQITWSKVINYWSREEKDYDINTLGCTQGKLCGHYTQVVWDKSGQVGCGKGYCHGPLSGNQNDIRYSIQYFCNYFESGNYEGYPPFKVTTGEHCQDCFTFDTERKFKCDKDKLCEVCKNELDGCMGLDDLKLLTAQGKICSDTNPFCDQNIHLCALAKSGKWMPPPVAEFVSNCNKTCKVC